MFPQKKNFYSVTQPTLELPLLNVTHNVLDLFFFFLLSLPPSVLQGAVTALVMTACAECDPPWLASVSRYASNQ